MHNCEALIEVNYQSATSKNAHLFPANNKLIWGVVE